MTDLLIIYVTFTVVEHTLTLVTYHPRNGVIMCWWHLSVYICLYVPPYVRLVYRWYILSGYRHVRT